MEKKKRTLITQDIKDQIVKLESQDVTISEIAKQLNIDRRSVYRCLRQEVPDREYIKYTEVTDEEVNNVRTMYLEQGMTPSEIAWKLEVSPRRIHGILTRYGIRKPRSGVMQTKEFNTKMPEKIDDPIYYPEREITHKVVKVNGKQYTDVSEFYGL